MAGSISKKEGLAIAGPSRRNTQLVFPVRASAGDEECCPAWLPEAEMTLPPDASGNYLVRVNAQVMTRDDSTGGWVPMGSGGLSHVSVCKSPGEEDKLEYLIFGKRIADQMVVLSCTIKKDFQYNKVMPTFHHWRTGDKKFGLTFQTAADARAFDKGVRMAIEDLSDGIGDFPNFHDSDLGDDDVFMTLELPVDSRSSSTSSTFSGGSLRPSEPTTFTHPHHHLHRMNFIRMNPSPSQGSNNNSIHGYVMDPTCHRKGAKAEQHDLSSYVQLSKGHDYSYPVVDGCKARDALKKNRNFDAFACQPVPRLPVKAKKKKKEPRRGLPADQCRHCRETYTVEDNKRGACEEGPDPVLACIRGASCISCAQCMLYHCMSDNEGDFSHHPCSCDTSDRHCPKRWTALALLSIIVPCLWCYLPLRACHKCGVRCGVCGGRHDPA